MYRVEIIHEGLVQVDRNIGRELTYNVRRTNMDGTVLSSVISEVRPSEIKPFSIKGWVLCRGVTDNGKCNCS